MFGCFENKTITEFKKPGVLNKFILSHLHDIEGCAKIVADLVMYIYEIENFLRKIVFMIEDENLLSTFIYHFLRLSYSTFPLGPIRRWIDSIGPVLLAAKVREYDLGTLIDNYYSDDLLAGILLRGYSYYLWDPDYEKKFEKIKDGDITFYYENNFKFGVKIKYQLEKINYDYIRKEDFLMEMVMFANSNCPKRKEVVLRCLNVLGFEFYHKYLKENEGKISELIIENPIGNFHLLHKLVDIYFDPHKSTAYKLIDLLIHGQGKKEKSILEIIKLFPIDNQLVSYILSNFEYFSEDTKMNLVSIIKGPIDQEIFEKYCFVIKNEKNLEIIKAIIKELNDRKVYFPIIENWKSNRNLENLLVMIYPLGMKDKEYYSKLITKCDEEKMKMIKEVYKI
jgi:hypothetical protein